MYHSHMYGYFQDFKLCSKYSIVCLVTDLLCNLELHESLSFIVFQIDGYSICVGYVKTDIWTVQDRWHGYLPEGQSS